jgi:transposase, IS5 family
MRQTKKGNQWYFGMKDRVGTNTKRGLVNKVVITDASVHDSQMMNGLIQESIVY